MHPKKERLVRFVSVVFIVSMTFHCYTNRDYELRNWYLYEQYLQEYDLPDLLDIKQEKKDRYIRIWFTDGRTHPVIYTLIYQKYIWRASCIKKSQFGDSVINDEIYIPQADWDVLWAKLNAMDFLYMKDWTQTNCFDPDTLEGWAIDVEAVIGEKYRNFSYLIPNVRYCFEAQVFTRAMNIIFQDLKTIKPQKKVHQEP